MNLIDNILTRHSTRKYDEHKKAKPEQIEQILRCAMQAPSAMNKQPWHFIVVDNPEVLAAIENVHPHAGFLKQAGTAIIVIGDTSSCWAEYWKVDPMLAGQNILLSAHALGLSTCWCGVYPNVERMENIADILNIPSEYRAIALIAVGTPMEDKKIPENRFDVTRIHHNEW